MPLISTWAAAGNESVFQPGSGAYGYAVGGGAPSALYSTICRLAFANDATTTLSSTLSVITSQLGGFESKTHGYACGGTTVGTAYSTKIEKLNFTTQTRFLASTTLPVGRVAHGGFSSLTNGYTVNGSTGSGVYTAAIVRVAFSNDATSTLGTTTGYNGGWPATTDSSTHGYSMGGYSGAFYSQAIKFSFSAETTTSLTGLNSARYAPFGVASSTAAYALGGAPSGFVAVSTIERWLFSNDSKSVLGATLNIARSGGESFESATAGYASRGNAPTNTVTKFLFSSETASAGVQTFGTSAYEGCGFSS